MEISIDSFPSVFVQKRCRLLAFLGLFNLLTSGEPDFIVRWQAADVNLTSIVYYEISLSLDVDFRGECSQQKARISISATLIFDILVTSVLKRRYIWTFNMDYMHTLKAQVFVFQDQNNNNRIRGTCPGIDTLLPCYEYFHRNNIQGKEKSRRTTDRYYITSLLCALKTWQKYIHKALTSIAYLAKQSFE